MTDDLYQEEIIHHFKHPQNYGELPDADIVIEEKNSSCGDAATFYLKLSKDKKTILDISFTSQGCAISTAASSILTEHLKGKSLENAQSIDQAAMEELIGAEIGTARAKCLMLAPTAIKKILTKKEH